MEGIPIRNSLRSTNNKENKLKIKNKTPRKMSKMNVKMDELKKKYGDFSI